MADEKKRMDDFRSSLADLKVNSKHHINKLTKLADDNKRYAEKIVEIIEARLDEAPSASKLPCLYLVDSIMKNVDKSRGDENKIALYTDLFAKEIVLNFCHVFQNANDATRESMLKLRKTWIGFFDNKTLYALDVGCSRINDGWPILAEPSPNNTPLSLTENNEDNPMCLQQKQQEHLQEGRDRRERRAHSPSTDATTTNKRRRLSERLNNEQRSDAYGYVDALTDDEEMSDVQVMEIIKQPLLQRKELEQQQQPLLIQQVVAKQPLLQQKNPQRQQLIQNEVNKHHEKEKHEKEMNEQHVKNVQIEKELRQQREIQLGAAARQSSSVRVVSTTGASAVAAESYGHGPHHRDSYDTISTEQRAGFFSTAAKPLSATNHTAPPMIPVDELGRLARGSSRPEAVRDVGFNHGPTLLSNGPPIRPPTFPVIKPHEPWEVRNTNPPSMAFGGGPPARQEFNASGSIRTDDNYHHAPPKIILPSMSVPPPRIQYPPPQPGPTVWNNHGGPMRTDIVLPDITMPPPMLHFPPNFLQYPPPAPTFWNNNVQPQPILSSVPATTVSVAAAIETPAPTTSVDVSKLLEQLYAAGIIPPNGDAAATMSMPASSQQSGAEDESILEPVPDLTNFDISSLRVRYSGVLGSLHQGVPCTQCGERFKSDELGRAMYKKHLDWHFKKNRQSKQGDGAARIRGWYNKTNDWTLHKDITAAQACEAALLEERNSAGAPNNPVASLGRADFDERPTASKGSHLDICPVCYEAFDVFFDNASDEWTLKDAVRYLGPVAGEEAEEGLVVGKTYHWICLEDAPKQDF